MSWRAKIPFGKLFQTWCLVAVITILTAFILVFEFNISTDFVILLIEVVVLVPAIAIVIVTVAVMLYAIWTGQESCER